MVLEHIQKLLFNHDCVIVPDFGGLITHYEPVRIHPIRHSFLPPAKRVAFNEQLKLNDGLLISTLAYDKKLITEEAQRQVAQFVHHLQQELNQNRRFDLKGIGVFRLNAENKINFEYIENENLLNDSFGLPELISKPVIATEPALLRTLLKEQSTPAQKGFQGTIRKYYRAAAALTVLGVAFTGLYFLSLQTDYNVSAINPVTLFRSEKPELESPEESLPVNEEISLAGNPNSEDLEVIEEANDAPWQSDTNSSVVAPPETNKSDRKVKANYTATTSKPIEVYNKDKVKIVVNTNTVISVSPSENESVKAVVPHSDKGIKPEKPVAANKEIKRNYTTAEINAALAAGKLTSKPKTATTKKAGPGSLPKTVVPGKLAAPNSNAAAIKEKAERFYVIVNGYSTYENAERNRKIIAKKGRTGQIIPPFGDAKLYRIAIAEYTNKEQALQHLPELKNKYGNTIWILKH